MKCELRHFATAVTLLYNCLLNYQSNLCYVYVDLDIFYTHCTFARTQQNEAVFIYLFIIIIIIIIIKIKIKINE